MNIETKTQLEHRLNNRVKQRIKDRIKERMAVQIKKFLNKNKAINTNTLYTFN